MGLLDKNGDLVINGQRIRSYNNLKDKNRPKTKDGFLRCDNRTSFVYFDADDGSQEELIDGWGHFDQEYGFEKIEEIGEAHRRKEREKRGYPKCYVCNIYKPSEIYLYVEKLLELWAHAGKNYSS